MRFLVMMLTYLKVYFLFFFLLLLSFISFASNEIKKFVWIDYSNHLHREIDLTNGNLQVELQPGVWKAAGKVTFEGVELSLFPKDFEERNVQVHPIRDGFVFKIQGTGLVFTFDNPKKVLKRIDKTFFRGFNFHSFSFYKKDTLYSIGGEGFWSTNSTLIYFDQSIKEWDKKATSNKGPESIEWDFGGYSASDHTFYCLEGKQEFSNNNFNEKSVFALDLGKLTWKELGKMNTSVFTNQIQVNQFKFWLGDFFLYLDGYQTFVYLLDPIHNKILQYKGNYAQAKRGSNEVFRDGDYVYIYHKDSNGDNLDSLSVKEFLKDSIEVGPMYYPKSFIPWDKVYYVLIFLLIIVALVFFMQKHKYQQMLKHIHKSTGFEGLSKQLLEVLYYFKTHGQETLISTNEMNEMLNIRTNSFESTRQQRSKDLKTINDFFLINYNIPDAIIRTNSDKDKRITFYQLNEKAFKVLDKL